MAPRIRALCAASSRATDGSRLSCAVQPPVSTTQATCLLGCYSKCLIGNKSSVTAASFLGRRRPGPEARIGRPVRRGAASARLRAYCPAWVRNYPCATSITFKQGAPTNELGARALAWRGTYSGDGSLGIWYFLSRRPRCRRSVPHMRAAADTLPLACSMRRVRKRDSNSVMAWFLASR